MERERGSRERGGGGRGGRGGIGAIREVVEEVVVVQQQIRLFLLCLSLEGG